MSIKGGAYPRFQRALATRNMAVIRAAAAELPRVHLADALAILIVMREREPASFERAALRWIARFVTECPRVTLEEVEMVAGELPLLPDQAAIRGLAAVCERHGLRLA